jgi:hypothetical protein
MDAVSIQDIVERGVSDQLLGLVDRTALEQHLREEPARGMRAASKPRQNGIVEDRSCSASRRPPAS